MQYTAIITIFIISNIIPHAFQAHISRDPNNTKKMQQTKKSTTTIILDGPPEDLDNRQCTDGLCEFSPDYPALKIKKLLSRVKKYQLRKLFGDVIKPSENKSPVKWKSLNEPAENVCETKKLKVFPKFIYGEDLKEYWVVNVKNFKQGIEYERCVSDKPKYLDEGSGPLNVAYTCEQQYTSLRFWVYNGKKDSIDYKEVRVPTSCACMYRHLN